MADKRVLLQWFSATSGNLGVGALTLSQLYLLSRAAQSSGVQCQVEIVGPASNSVPDYVTGKTFAGISSIKFSPTKWGFPSFLGYVRGLRSADLVIDISQGDSYATIYGPRRFISQTLTKQLALWLTKTVVFAPQTYGPYQGRFATWFASRQVCKAEVAFARDTRSRRSLTNAAREVLRSTSDLAFALPFSRKTPEPGSLTVGLNVSGLLWNDGTAFGIPDYPAMVRKLAAELVDRGVSLKLVPHVIGGISSVDSDSAVLREVADATGINAVINAVDPEQVKSEISGLDVLIASRMHACIAGISAGVAVIPIAYSKKFEGLMETIGYPAVVDPRGATAEHVADRILALIDQHEALGSKATEAARTALEQLETYSAYLTEVLSRE